MKGEETTGSAQTWRIGTDTKTKLYLLTLKTTQIMARLTIKKYKNNNDKSTAYGKTYGRLVHQDTMNTSDLCRSLLSHSYQAYMFILTQRRRGRRVHAENYNISHRKHRTNRAARAERCLHQFCRVAMEEDDSQSTEIYYFPLIMII